MARISAYLERRAVSAGFVTPPEDLAMVRRRKNRRQDAGRYIDRMTTVVAGILTHHGRILICRRRADQPHPLKWEFPGGKLEPDESPQAALTRELREELGIESTVGAELMRYEFAYPEKKPILLIFFEVANWQGEIENRIFEEILWENPDALRTHDFLEGDERYLAFLTDSLPRQ